MKNTLFGLDIGATSIKAVWLSEDKDGYILNSAAIINTPPKGMFSDNPIDQMEIAQSIKKLVFDAKINTPNVAISLPESQVYTKVIEMPVLSDKELASAINWEAEQYIPVPLESVTIDTVILNRPKNWQEGTLMQVLLVGAPNFLVDKYYNIINLAGLIPVAMDTEILSVVRAIVIGDKFANCIILHIGAVSTAFAIIRNGIIFFTFNMPTGGIAINMAIATDYGFTLSQAEEYKKTYGVSQKSFGGKIGQTTAPILMSIILEIKKSISFYSEKYKDSPVQEIILSGGTARLPGIDVFFAQNSGLETVIANPWAILNSQEVPQQIIENATDYSVAVGLAMRHYE
ncbi:pilus assembly protein PilM [Candidatus Levyibacteriota bacterium]|nr:pilus assembly protein PilM [Candidatus Levybacteria bacterium]